MTQELINISSLADLDFAFNHMGLRFQKNGLVPYIHFDIHGSRDGLQLKNGVLVKWDYLQPKLSELNYKIGNALFVSLASCFGAYFFRTVDPLERTPFFGYIGPVNEITVNETEIDWAEYFNSLFSTKDFLEAIKSLIKSNGRAAYSFFSGEQIWDICSKGFLALYETRTQKRQKMLELRRQAKKTIPGLRISNSQLKDRLKKNINNRPALIGQMKDYFLLRSDVRPNFDG